MAPKKIIIIDDEEDFCLLLKNYFLKKNYEVEVYHFLNEGLKALENQPTCIVFLDNNLPDGLGWTKITEINEKFPGLKLHLLSGYHYTSAAIQRGGQVRVWQKPVTFGELDKYFK